MIDFAKMIRITCVAMLGMTSLAYAQQPGQSDMSKMPGMSGGQMQGMGGMHGQGMGGQGMGGVDGQGTGGMGGKGMGGMNMQTMMKGSVANFKSG